jgi:hypothetical protein
VICEKKTFPNTLIRLIDSRIDIDQWYRHKVRTFPKEGAEDVYLILHSIMGTTITHGLYPS